MRRLRWRTVALGAAVGIVSTFAPGALPVPSASASDGNFLQVTPEVTDVQVGTNVTLTANLYSTALSVLDRQAPLVLLQPVIVRFAFEGGPLQGTDDTQCTISQPSTCSITVASEMGGTTLVRAWIDGHTPDTEGRLANNLAPTAKAADCITAEEGEKAPCVPGDAPSEGTVTEPDSTDVVRITWRERGLDVSPDNQERLLGETATLTAAVNDMAGNPVAGIPVDFELFEGSVSDPGGGNTPNIPDKSCITGASGTCSITFTQPSAGTDLLCAWTSAAPPTMAGKVSDTGTCDSEVLFDLSANDGKPSPLDDDLDVVRIIWKAPAPTTTTPTGPGTTPLPAGNGYFLVAADGGVFAFGEAVFQGSTGALRLNQPVVAIAHTPSRNGYFLAASDGGIFAFGDAVFRGSTGALKLARPVVGMAATPTGRGYWLVASDGGVFAFGDAVFAGSTGALRLAQPIVGMTPTPTGHGYFLVAADGGVFAFGDAVFRGSTGAIKLAQPIVGIAPTPTGNGYYLAAADGGVFAFGDAVFRGSTGAIRLAQPMVGISGSASGGGYRLVARDGGVFAFGDAAFRGSTGAIRLAQPMVGMTGF